MNFDSDRTNYWSSTPTSTNKNSKETKRNSYNPMISSNYEYNRFIYNDNKQFDNKIYYRQQQTNDSNQNRNRRSLSTFPSSSTNNNNVYPNPYYSNYDVEFDYQNNCYYSYDVRDKVNDANYYTNSNSSNNKSNSPNYSIACDDIEIFNRLNREDLMVDHLRWLSEKPISVLQLDPADRAVLKIAGMYIFDCNLFINHLFTLYLFLNRSKR